MAGSVNLGSGRLTFYAKDADVRKAFTRMDKNISKLEGSLKRLSSQMARSTRSFSSFSKSLSSIGKGALGILGITTAVSALTRTVGFFERSTLDALNYAASLVEVAQNVDILPTKLEALRGMLLQDGVNYNATAKAIQHMNRRLSEARMGMESAARPFRDLGLDIEEMINRMTGIERIVAVGEALASVSRHTERTRISMELFERAGTKILGTFIKFGGQLQEQIDLYDKHTKATSQQLRDVKVLSGELQRVWDQLLDEFVRIIAERKEQILKFINGILTAFNALFTAGTAVFDRLTGHGAKLDPRQLRAQAAKQKRTDEYEAPLRVARVLKRVEEDIAEIEASRAKNNRQRMQEAREINRLMEDRSELLEIMARNQRKFFSDMAEDFDDELTTDPRVVAYEQKLAAHEKYLDKLDRLTGDDQAGQFTRYITEAMQAKDVTADILEDYRTLAIEAGAPAALIKALSDRMRELGETTKAEVMTRDEINKRTLEYIENNITANNLSQQTLEKWSAILEKIRTAPDLLDRVNEKLATMTTLGPDFANVSFDDFSEKGFQTYNRLLALRATRGEFDIPQPVGPDFSDIDFTAVDNINQKLTEQQQLWQNIGRSIQSNVVGGLAAAIQGTKSWREALLDIVNNVFSQILQAMIQMALFGAGGFGSGGGLFGAIFGAQLGGPVRGGRPYIVGERGPELFIPSQSGMIESNRKLMGGGVNVNIQNAVGAISVQDPVAVRKAIGESLPYIEQVVRESTVIALNDPTQSRHTVLGR